MLLGAEFNGAKSCKIDSRCTLNLNTYKSSAHRLPVTSQRVQIEDKMYSKSKSVYIHHE